jgi:hypothetical protein
MLRPSKSVALLSRVALFTQAIGLVGAAGCHKAQEAAQAQLTPILFGRYDGPTLDGLVEPPYPIELDTVSLQAKTPDLLPVMIVVPDKMPFEHMARIARKWGFTGHLERLFGSSPDEWDTWVVKTEDHVLTFWPGLWRWEWTARSFARDLEWQLEHESLLAEEDETYRSTLEALAKKPGLKSRDLDAIIRRQLTDSEILPPEARMDPVYAVTDTGIGAGSGSVLAVTEYTVVYRVHARGYEVASVPNSCSIVVSAAKERVVKVSAAWVPLEPDAAYSLRTVEDAFRALRDGQGEQILPPFTDGKASFSGILYHVAHGEEFHPCYRFTVRARTGDAQYFFVPAIRSEHYKHGISVICTNESEGMTEDELRSRVLEMIEKTEQDCRPLLDGRYARAPQEAEDDLSNICWNVGKFAARIPANLVPSVKRQWAEASLSLADRLLAAIGTDVRPEGGPNPLQGTLAHIADDLCELVEKHGSAEDREAVKRLRARYSRRWKWAKEFIFGIE